MRHVIYSRTLFILSILLALIVHLLILYAVSLVRFNIKTEQTDYLVAEFRAYTSPKTTQKTVEQSVPTIKISEKEQPVVEIPKEIQPTNIHVENVTVADSMPRLNRMIFFSSDPFVMQTLPEDERQAIQDSINKYRSTMHIPDYSDSLHPFEMTGSMDALRNPPQHGHLPIPKIIHEIAKAMRKKQAQKPIKLDFIPSDNQIKTLNIIWRQELASDRDIYIQLDSNAKMMMSDLNILLEDLTKKGIVTRRMVSPKNEFTLYGIPLFEMNPLNRKNRIYQYTSRITQEELITFLNAQEYNASTDSANIVAKNIQRKILLVNKEMD